MPFIPAHELETLTILLRTVARKIERLEAGFIGLEKNHKVISVAITRRLGRPGKLRDANAELRVRNRELEKENKMLHRLLEKEV